MRRKNTKFVDPRYFMDEKTEVIKEWVVAPGRDSRGEPVGNDEQDSEIQMRDEIDGQLIEILKEALEEALMAYDYGGLDVIPGIIRRLEEALDLLGEEPADKRIR